MIILPALILLGTIFQGVAMFRSGMLYDYGIGYFGPLARDGVWHEALVGQLINGFPAQNPGFAGQILTNYHYFYDMLVAAISKIIGISAPFIIYRFLPVLFSTLLGIGTYLLSQKLFKDKLVSYLAVFFAFFGSSFGWIISIIKHEEIGGESSFWANQPVSMNLNPPFAISLVILTFSVILLDNFLKKPKVIKGIILSIAFGVLVGFKAYAGAIVLAALFAITVKKIIFDKSFALLPVFIGSAAIFSVIYLFVSKGGAGLIALQPLWLVNTMIDAGDRVGITDFTAKRFAYLGGGKWFYFAVIEIVSLAIFLVGNLGTRIVSFWGIRRKYLKSDLHLFILFLSVASLVPPLLFVQKGNPWNVIQFFYYFLFFTSLYCANAVRKFPAVVIVVILLLTPISSLATFRSWLYPNPPAYLPKGEYEGLSFLKTADNGTVLKYPFDSSLRGKYKDPFPLAVYADNAYVSAVSGKPVFVEDVEQQLILNVDYQTRLDNAERFFTETDLSWSNKFLKNNNISYVYLPKIYQLPMAEQEYSMKKIFENKDVNIYQINK